MRVGNTPVSQSEFWWEEDVPGELGAGLSTTSHLKLGWRSLSSPALFGLEGSEKNTTFWMDLRLLPLEPGEILGYGINQNQDKLFRNLSNMIPQQIGDTQHTHMGKKNT